MSGGTESYNSGHRLIVQQMLFFYFICFLGGEATPLKTPRALNLNRIAKHIENKPDTSFLGRPDSFFLLFFCTTPQIVLQISYWKYGRGWYI